MRIRRSRPAFAVCAAAIALTAAGCSSSSSSSATAAEPSQSGPITMQFWGWAPGYQQIAAKWNAAHPDEQVVFKQIPSGGKGGYTQISDAISADKGPCLAQIEYDVIPSMLVKNDVMDITQYASADMSKYASSAVAASSVGGKIYGVPVDLGPMVLFYRKDLFAKYGITTPPATWAQYETDAEKVAAQNSAVKFGTAPQDGNDMAALTWQTGDSWYATSGSSWTVSIANSGTEKVAAFWQDMKNKGLLLNSGNAWDPQFDKASEQGDIAAFVNAGWAAAGLKQDLADLSGKWAVAPLPTWSAGQAAGSDNGGSDTSVMTGCKTPREAEQFATYLSSNEQALDIDITVGGLYPAAKAGQDNALLQKGDAYFGGQDIYSVLKQSAAEIPATWVNGPTYQQVETDFTTAIGQGSYPAAVSSVQQSTITAIKGLGLSVTGG
jgi:multiple sugar transport system substrate-binding protein